MPEYTIETKPFAGGEMTHIHIGKYHGTIGTWHNGTWACVNAQGYCDNLLASDKGENSTQFVNGAEAMAAIMKLIADLLQTS